MNFSGLAIEGNNFVVVDNYRKRILSIDGTGTEFWHSIAISGSMLAVGTFDASDKAVHVYPGVL